MFQILKSYGVSKEDTASESLKTRLPYLMALNNQIKQLKLIGITSKKKLLEKNKCYITWAIVKISKTNVKNDLYQIGYVSHYDVCLPHCDLLYKHN